MISLISSAKLISYLLTAHSSQNNDSNPMHDDDSEVFDGFRATLGVDSADAPSSSSYADAPSSSSYECIPSTSGYASMRNPSDYASNSTNPCTGYEHRSFNLNRANRISIVDVKNPDYYVEQMDIAWESIQNMTQEDRENLNAFIEATISKRKARVTELRNELLAKSLCLHGDSQFYQPAANQRIHHAMLDAISKELMKAENYILGNRSLQKIIEILDPVQIESLTHGKFNELIDYLTYSVYEPITALFLLCDPIRGQATKYVSCLIPEERIREIPEIRGDIPRGYQRSMEGDMFKMLEMFTEGDPDRRNKRPTEGAMNKEHRILIEDAMESNENAMDETGDMEMAAETRQNPSSRPPRHVSYGETQVIPNLEAFDFRTTNRKRKMSTELFAQDDKAETNKRRL